MVKSPDIPAMLAEYDAKRSDYEELGPRTESLLSVLLAGRIRSPSVTNRIKERDSLERKLALGEDKYRALTDVTDLVGLRVITYFADDVDRVAAIVRVEFEIDEEHSGDRRLSIEADRFGYLSTHFVASHLPARTALAEWKRLAHHKFEIQIRSILQHAWAEIEHDLGYKATEGTPRTIRRRFSRLAGLLELADDEFAAIRDDLNRYRSDVQQTVTREPKEVGVDQESLAALVQRSDVTEHLDHHIADLIGNPLDTEVDGGYLARQAGRLRELGLETVDAVERALKAKTDLISAFAREWVHPESSDRRVARGISFFYLVLVTAASEDPNLLQRLLIGYGWSAARARATASRATTVYGKVSRQ